MYVRMCRPRPLQRLDGLTDFTLHRPIPGEHEYSNSENTVPSRGSQKEHKILILLEKTYKFVLHFGNLWGPSPKIKPRRVFKKCKGVPSDHKFSDCKVYIRK
jgi:hypothetical protein